MRFLSYELPQLRAATTSTATVELENAGTGTWHAFGPAHIRLSYHWLDRFGNVLVWEGRATVIDFPQAVDPRKNRHARALLERDVTRICDHFERFGVRSNAHRIAGDLWTAWEFADLVPEELRTGIEI